MKKLVVILLLFVAVFAASGQQIPAVQLQDASGKAVTTASLVDHKTPFVISIWMTTCKPCLKELDTISEEYPDWDASFPLRIYAVSMDDSRSSTATVIVLSILSLTTLPTLVFLRFLSIYFSSFAVRRVRTV